MEERNIVLAKELGKMIKCETVSNDKEIDLKKMHVIHKVMKDLFPNVFKRCVVEEFNGSLLIKWAGKDSSLDPIMFMNHHDVVEAKGDWSVDPFGAVIKDGKLYGRGTLDTKGGLYCMLKAADELIHDGFVPSRDIYFESSCTEEVGGEGAINIAKALKERGIKLEFCLDEGGMIAKDPLNFTDNLYGMVGMGEKGYCDIKFTAKGHGGHSSTPSKNSPIVRIGKFMVDCEKSKLFQVKINPIIQEMFIRLGKNAKQPVKALLTHPRLFGPVLKAVVPSVSPLAGALLQTTLAFTVIKGNSDMNNVIPEEVSVVGNIRFSHHQGSAKSKEAVIKIANKYGLEVEVLDPGVDSGISDFHTRGFELIEKGLQEAFEGKVAGAVPYIMTGGSDSRFIGKVCDNCVRFVPFIVSNKQIATIHSVDENVDIDTLPPAVEFYKYLMLNY